eukprot:Nk52_evm11s356 gene=Nk52_evmTU11s356
MGNINSAGLRLQDPGNTIEITSEATSPSDKVSISKLCDPRSPYVIKCNNRNSESEANSGNYGRDALKKNQSHSSAFFSSSEGNEIPQGNHNDKTNCSSNNNQLDQLSDETDEQKENNNGHNNSRKNNNRPFKTPLVSKVRSAKNDLLPFDPRSPGLRRTPIPSPSTPTSRSNGAESSPTTTSVHGLVRKFQHDTRMIDYEQVNSPSSVSSLSRRASLLTPKFLSSQMRAKNATGNNHLDFSLVDNDSGLTKSENGDLLFGVEDSSPMYRAGRSDHSQDVAAVTADASLSNPNLYSFQSMGGAIDAMSDGNNQIIDSPSPNQTLIFNVFEKQSAGGA